MKRSPVSTILPLLPFLLLPFAAGGQTESDPLLSGMRELHTLKQEMEENRRKITELQQKEKTLGEVEERIRRDRDMTARYIAELEQQERVLLQDLAAQQGQLDLSTTDFDQVAAVLRRRVRAYQRARRSHTAEILLSSRDFSELFSRGALLARAIRRDQSDLAWLRSRREELARDRSILESRRRGLETLQEEKRREKARLDRKSHDARGEIAGVRIAREAFEERQKELAESEKKIQALITRLEEEAREAGRVRSGPGLEGRRGGLRWPAEGEVVARFGLDTHPRFKTKVPSRGIDIAAPAGTPVRAVAGGAVEFADWLSGYGRCIIINHGEGYYTLYAHCRRLLVGQGSRVEEGEQIAEVGDTDSIRGSCLHFEVRYREKAFDPQEWLR